MVAIGVLCACLGGLGGAWAWHRAAHADQVLVMTRSVGRGEVVRSTDVGLTSVSVDGSVRTMPASSLDQVVGRHALVDLPAGHLLGSGSVGELTVKPGRARVGLKLPAGRVPSVSLPAGASVTIVETAPEHQGDAEAGTTTVDATVVAAPRSSGDHGSWLVDVEVAADEAARLADLAARDRVALVERSG